MGGVTDGQTVVNGLKSIFSGSKDGKWKPFSFTLFTSFTPITLLILSGLIFWQRMNNEHINCYSPPDEDIRDTAVNQYCFITGTYTVTEYPERMKHIQRLLPYPGIGPSKAEGTKVKFHLYFQWVPFLLFFQAILFSAPNLIWKCLQQDSLWRYCNALSDDNDEDDKIQKAAKRFRRNIRHQSSFSTWFFFCQLINLGVAAIAFLLSDMLLAEEFSSLGRDWINHLQTYNSIDSDPQQYSELNPLNRVFPKMSKCEFKKFGPGGGIVNYDLICVMTLNVLHDKVFLFLWFWLLMLIIFQTVNLFFHLVILRVKDLQCFLVLRRVEPAYLVENDKNEDYTDCIEMDSSFKRSSKKFLRQLGYNDWYFLWAISHSTDANQFTKFFEHLVTFQSSNRPNDGDDRYEQEETIIPQNGRESDGWQNNDPFYSKDNFVNVVNKQNDYHNPAQITRNHGHNTRSRRTPVETLYTPLNESLKEMRQQEGEESVPLIRQPHNITTTTVPSVNYNVSQTQFPNISHPKSQSVHVPDGSNDHDEPTDVPDQPKKFRGMEEGVQLLISQGNDVD